MAGFDVRALYAAVDAERTAQGLSWPALAEEIWSLSAGLNARRDDHPISPTTLRWSEDRRGVSCQHALFMLRWLGKAPEDFVAGAAPVVMADPGPDYRLRWNLPRLADAVNRARQAHGMTWAQAAERARCTPSQLSGLRDRKFAVSMRLAVRLAHGLHRPTTDFIDAARW